VDDVDLVGYVAIAIEVTGLDTATIMPVARLDLADSSRWSARPSAFVTTRGAFGTSTGRPDTVANTVSSGAGEPPAMRLG
jgi:hypothetical protein